MNQNTYTAECLHGQHSACTGENACACSCHLDEDMLYDDPYIEEEEAERALCPECDAAILEGDPHEPECPYA